MNSAVKARLQAVLASYGADPARWPAADRELLSPLLGSAGEALEEARLIDRLLDLAAAPQPQVEFEKRLMERIARPAAPDRFPLPWSATLPLAASLILGVFLGAMGDLDRLFPPVVTGDVAAVDDDSSDIDGVTEATDYSGDQLA